jgi:hexosaminidase
MRFIIVLFIISLFTTSILAQEVQIIPQPAHLTKRAGSFTITKNTSIVIQNEEDKKSTDFLNCYLKQIYGFQLPVQKQATGKSITISTNNNTSAADKDAYTFESNPAGVVIKGDTYAGTFYGVQTLIQLLPTKMATSLKIPSVQIQDEPRFGHRGSLLDVGRHFFPVAFIKKYIDFLALHKMNYFHWHLTDDAGWRIEIKKYPKLTEVGAWRNRSLAGRYPGIGFINHDQPYGGYYTQEQIKDIVRYASDRYITILPEIEMPGHSYAALASYPQLGCSGGPYTVPEVYRVDPQVFCAGQEYTFEFLQNVLDEVMILFPSKYIHIGGDECPKEGWKQCSRCQARIRQEGLKDEHELQSYFIRRIEKYLNSKGRTLVGWDEILEGGLVPNAVVMSWRGENGGIAAAKEKHYVIMTPSSEVYWLVRSCEKRKLVYTH